MNAIAFPLLALSLLGAPAGGTRAPHELHERSARARDEEPAAGGPEREPAGTPRELVERANTLVKSEKYDEAITLYGRAQRDEPNSPEIDFDLGIAHRGKGENERAAEYFASATSKGGGVLAPRAQVGLGNARASQGRFKEAVSAYREALRLDPSCDGARWNLEIVEKHLAKLEELEKQRKEAEKKLKKLLEEMRKSIAALIERQAEALARTWASDPASKGPMVGPRDIEALKSAAEKGEEPGEVLLEKLARSFAEEKVKDAAPAEAEELAGIERSLAGEAEKVAGGARKLAEALSSGAPEGAPQNPMAASLEKVGGLVDDASKLLVESAVHLGTGEPFKSAERVEARALWRLLAALAALSAPQGGQDQEALKRILKKLAELRRLQGELVADTWASFPESRGALPGPEEQRAFWKKLEAGEAPAEEERVRVARLELSAGKGGSGRSGAELAEAQRDILKKADELASELKSAAAVRNQDKGGQAPPVIADVLARLRSASEAMKEAAGYLDRIPEKHAAGDAEAAGLLAYARLTRLPSRLEMLLAKVGMLLAAESRLLLDTWATEPGSRGREPTEEEMKAAAEPSGGLSDELESALGRKLASALEGAGAGGKGRPAEELAKAQEEVAAETTRVAEGLRSVAAGSGSVQDPAAKMIDEAASEIEGAASRMKSAREGLASADLGSAEPEEARAVCKLMRALSRFASQAGAQPQEGERKGQREREEREGEEKGEAADREAARAREKEQEEGDSDEEDEKKDEREVSEEQAARLLEELAQEERRVRRDMRLRRGLGEVRVERDW